MKTTLDLPDDLVKEIKLRAVHDGKKLKETAAELLRKGLNVETKHSPATVRVGKKILKRRKTITRKFISGEWGVELAGIEASRTADRQKESQRAKAYRR